MSVAERWSHHFHLPSSRVAARESRFALLMLLATIQFVHVLDFVIVMPLAPQLMRLYNMSPQSFGFLISAYQLSAAAASLGGAIYLDRLGRRQALLYVFGGFLLGTLACAFATGPGSLLAARIVTGAFGGLIQALLFAIVGDCFSEDRRGAATGTVMSAFSIASVVGVPIALALANAWDWRAPFVFLALLSVAAWYAAYRLLPPLTTHLEGGALRSRYALVQARELLTERNTLAAFALTTALMFAGFLVIPYMSAYLVGNVGLVESDLATVFLAGGVATIFTSRLAGRMADRHGKLRVFTWLALLSVVPVLALTHLRAAPLAAVLVVTTGFTVLVSARAVPALAMITSCAASRRRGGFMSLTSSVQQATSGLASLAAGLILGSGLHGEILRFDIVGYLAVAATITAIFASRLLKPAAVSK